MHASQLLMLHLGVSWGLLVLIWMVQVIVYPGFHRIASTDFSSFHRWYVTRISVIVMPLMTAEAVMTVWWLLGTRGTVPLLALLLVTSVWLSTFLLQVPIHNRLKSGKDPMLIRRLTDTNWIRTTAWSCKALVLTYTIFR